MHHRLESAPEAPGGEGTGDRSKPPGPTGTPVTRATTASRDRCPWCGAAGKSTLCDYSYDREPLHSLFRDQIPGEGHRFVVHECDRCRTLYQQTILDEEATAAYYGSWPFQETPLEFTLFYLQEILMVLSHFDRPGRDIRLFDCGMGWGKFCEVARTLGIDVHGYDLNPRMREYVRARAIPVVDRLEDLEPESFDFINLEQVLEHVGSPRTLTQSLARALKPGGIMKLSVPIRPLGIEQSLRRLEATAPADLYRKIMAVWPLSHVNCFNPKGLKTVLSETLRPRRIHLNSLLLVLRRDCGHRVLGRAVYKNYAPRVNYLFFRKV